MGWKPIALGGDYANAVKAAQNENERVELWRTGGAKPKQVKKFHERASVAALIDSYRKDEAFTGLAPNTQKTYGSALNLIEEWATDPKTGKTFPAAYITGERVKALKLALMRPQSVRKTAESDACPGHEASRRDAEICKHCEQPIKVGHHRAHNTLRVLRTLYAYGLSVNMVEKNPAESFDLSTPAPRDQIWDHEDSAAFVAAARRGDYPSLAFAVELAEYIGQREEDMLTLQASQWREVHNLDPELHRVLAGSDGRVMGLFIRQKKGSHGLSKRWVGIPIAGEMRSRIEKAIAINAKLPIPSTTILVDDVTKRPWAIRQFIRKFVEAKQRAVEPTAKDLVAGVKPHPALADLQFRDLRRTCVVRLGELGLEDQLISAITGHKLESVKKILEVYMPRTTKMAARAVIARIGRQAPEKEGQTG